MAVIASEFSVEADEDHFEGFDAFDGIVGTEFTVGVALDDVVFFGPSDRFAIFVSAVDIGEAAAIVGEFADTAAAAADREIAVFDIATAQVAGRDFVLIEAVGGEVVEFVAAIPIKSV